MHLKKPVLSLAACILSAFSTVSSMAQTPAVVASTNYVSTNGALHVSGSGFIPDDYVKVFIDDYRAPKFAFYVDTNGCFDLDLTYGGPYRIPDVQYRFSNSGYTEPSFTVHYQAAEIPWYAGPATFQFEAPEVVGTNVIPWVKITSFVARGGHTYQVEMSTNLVDWTFVGRSWVNDTWTNAAFASDFPISPGPCAFFRIADPTAH